MIMNAGWIQHTSGDFLFYREGFTEAVGRVTAAVDAERIAVAKALGVPAMPFLDVFYNAGLTTKAARDSGDIARACKESAPNKTIKSPSSLDHRYVHEDVGYGLVPMAALGRLAGVATPTIDALIHLAGLAVGIDYARDGLTLEKLGLAGKSPRRAAALRRPKAPEQECRWNTKFCASCARPWPRPGTTRWSRSRRTTSPIRRASWCRATRATASAAPSRSSPASTSRRRSSSTSRRTWRRQRSRFSDIRAYNQFTAGSGGPAGRCAAGSGRRRGTHRDRARLHARAGLHPAARAAAERDIRAVPRAVFRCPHDQDRRRDRDAAQRSAR